MKKTLTALALSAGLALSACGAIDTALDCRAICVRYQTCFDSTYDVGNCEARCRTNSNDAAYRSSANQCSACIDDRSCASATFGCTTQCASVVP
jgi:hypothetical protein